MTPAMPAIAMQIGDGALIATLDRLETRLQRQVASRSIRAGAKILLAQAKRNAPVRTGALRTSLKVRAGRRSRDSVSIDVGAGAKWFTGDEFYAAFVEWGHKTGSRKTPATGRNEVPGRHFVERAYEVVGQAAITAIEQQFLGDLEAIAGRP